MSDLDRALMDIHSIRTQLAWGSQFRGYGPLTVGATALIALAAAGFQGFCLPTPAANARGYLELWAVTAALSFALIVLEAIFRSRRAHGGLAYTMLQSALEPFLPAIVAGGLLTWVLARTALASVWLLPAMWQILFSLGVFASRRLLPPGIFVVGVWYLVCGLGCLALLGPARSLSPWAMGAPFAIGQVLVAGILRARRCDEAANDPS